MFFSSRSESRIISDIILKLYADEALRAELGENGKHFVRNEFSWEQTSKKLLHLYDNLLN